MNRAELATAIGKKTGDGAKSANRAVNAFIEVIYETLKEKDFVKLTGFGEFHMVEHAPRIRHNPATGKSFMSETVLVPRFKTGAQFKAAVRD